EHFPLIVRLGKGSLKESKRVAAVFFFLVLFLSLRLPVEMWNSRGNKTQGRGTNHFPNHEMVKRRLLDPAPAGSPTHAQMLALEDSAIRVATCFWQACKEQ